MKRIARFALPAVLAFAAIGAHAADGGEIGYGDLGLDPVTAGTAGPLRLVGPQPPSGEIAPGDLGLKHTTGVWRNTQPRPAVVPGAKPVQSLPVIGG